ncbi:hypothetical protein AYI68_g4207 [Smittium mucronatum]|uniref:Uncharacterized protein n=1 Tax=Smittium mucronatum TaxID=133383 RepID=A0A1R0GXS5_9FUNG|nr:hypothetical protein AYI68_g4207 [Smittium mucronatum]
MDQDAFDPFLLGKNTEKQKRSVQLFRWFQQVVAPYEATISNVATVQSSSDSAISASTSRSQRNQQNFREKGRGRGSQTSTIFRHAEEKEKAYEGSIGAARKTRHRGNTATDIGLLNSTVNNSEEDWRFPSRARSEKDIIYVNISAPGDAYATSTAGAEESISLQYEFMDVESNNRESNTTEPAIL